MVLLVCLPIRPDSCSWSRYLHWLNIVQQITSLWCFCWTWEAIITAISPFSSWHSGVRHTVTVSHNHTHKIYKMVLNTPDSELLDHFCPHLTWEDVERHTSVGSYVWAFAHPAVQEMTVFTVSSHQPRVLGSSSFILYWWSGLPQVMIDQHPMCEAHTDQTQCQTFPAMLGAVNKSHHCCYGNTGFVVFSLSHTWVYMSKYILLNLEQVNFLIEYPPTMGRLNQSY